MSRPDARTQSSRRGPAGDRDAPTDEVGPPTRAAPPPPPSHARWTSDAEPAPPSQLVEPAPKTIPARRDAEIERPRPDVPSRWERALRWIRPPRRLKFTREGKYFLGITLGVGLAAINTGNNLLYLLLGMLLSLIVVSSVLSELSLRSLAVTRRLPPRAQVGRAHLVEIEVFNHKKRIPSYAIEVEDLRSGQPADKRCFFLKISPASAQVAAYRRTPARRGIDRHTGFRIATRFPFGLFEKSREVTADGDLVIYPAVDPVRLPPDAPGQREGSGSVLGRGQGEETMGLRNLRLGDDPRDIYWRKSTRADQIVVRERARETRPDVVLRLDCVRPAESPGDGGKGGEADPFSPVFERRVRDVASRAVAHIKRGDGVVVVTTTGQRVRGDRTFGADPILRFLATVEAVDEATAMRLRSSVRALGPRELEPA